MRRKLGRMEPRPLRLSRLSIQGSTTIHVDLASNIWTNPNEIANNGIDDDRNGYTDDVRGWNFVSNNNNPMDDNGHGTHVAGTIGAVGNNGIGIAGVAWGIKMMALKFLDSTGSGDLSDAVSAIDYARVKGAKVINASWGGGNFTTALQSAMQRFQSAGGIFVAAAGNESANNDLVTKLPREFCVFERHFSSSFYIKRFIGKFLELRSQCRHRCSRGEHLQHDTW